MRASRQLRCHHDDVITSTDADCAIVLNLAGFESSVQGLGLWSLDPDTENPEIWAGYTAASLGNPIGALVPLLIEKAIY